MVKEKNQSALIYVNDTPGKGEVGTDLKSIPSAALQNVEVLRDGASAQYGSDAIAGVINIILKNSVGKSTVNLFSGITSKGDGFNIGADFNTGIRVAKTGSLNLTFGFPLKIKRIVPDLLQKMIFLVWIMPGLRPIPV